MAQIQTKFLANASVTAAKLGSVTDGVTLDQSGSGSTLQIKTGGITNTQINAAAAIAYSKLNLSNSIVNADIASGAAIAVNKLAALTANKAIASDASGFLTASTTTDTELGYVSGVTSSIQTQLNNKQSTLTFADSLVNNAGTVTLVGDTGSPGPSQYYGTDGSSTLGYYNLPTPGTGTVTSVAFSDASSTPIYSVSGSPVTSSGTLSITLATQTANKVFAGPSTGSAAQPTFRSLVSADIPDLSSIYLALAGGTMAGDINMASNKITNLGAPTSALDATNKTYVDNLVQGLSWKEVVRSSTTAGLPSYTYISGVITASSNGALTAQDGVTLAANDRLLVKNETSTNAPFNGIYVVTAVGDASHPFILTRSSDADTATELEWATVQVGPEASTLGGFIFRESANITTIGTDNVTFVNVTQGTALVFTSGTQLSGNTVSANVDNSTIDVNGSSQLEVKTGGITNTQINASAAIARSKLATATINTFATNNGSGVLSATSVTANRAVATDSNGLPVASATTDTELGYVSGVTSSIQTQLNALSRTSIKETFTLSSGDITNQYIDLAHVAKAGSIVFMVKGGPVQMEGSSYDYTVSLTGGTGGNTRISFVNDLATGGVSALVAADVLQIQYEY